MGMCLILVTSPLKKKRPGCPFSVTEIKVYGKSLEFSPFFMFENWALSVLRLCELEGVKGYDSMRE